MAQKQADLIKPALANHPLAAGLDEVGRGCLAGPVVAAAVVLPGNCMLDGLDDSKKLKPLARARLAVAIKKQALAWSLGVVWQDRIDRINILNASLEAMCKAAGNLRPLPVWLLIDGNQAIRSVIFNALWPAKNARPLQKTIVHGDQLVPSIAAASILAKTWRDNLMLHLAKRWPGYGFETNMGYGTPGHLKAIARLGFCPLHRKSFRGVANA